MTRSVLLINPFCHPTISYGEFSVFLTFMPPIGLAYLLGALEQAQCSPLFYDDLLNQGNNQLLTGFLKKHNPKILGLPLYTSSEVYRFHEIVAVARTIVPDICVVAGNIHSNVFADELLQKKQADIIVIGEGEQTLCELCIAIQNNETLKNIPGIKYRNEKGSVIETTPREKIENLDLLAFPAWHLMPLKKYRILLFARMATREIFILGSRGCPYQCSFCSLIIQGNQRRTRSPQNICDEIELAVTKYHIKAFHFIDALFPLTQKEGILVCKEIIRRNLHKQIIWVTETRIDAIDDELLTYMYRAGCRRILYGIESGTQKNLDNIQKRIEKQKIIQTIRSTKKHKISAVGLFMIGLPEETEQDIEETIRFSLKLDLDGAKFAVFVPYPGTKAFQNLKEKGKLNPENIHNWNAYTTNPTLKNKPLYLYENLSLEKLVQLQKQSYVSFYLRPKIILRNLHLLSKISVFELYIVFTFFLKLFWQSTCKVLGKK
jgi:radical SAM superfamily enzyme YgiQ (UPF0313 family)